MCSRGLGLLVTVVVALSAAACLGGEPGGTPPISPGSGSRPREVNLIARDWEFVPPVVDLVPGETVLLHVVNGGLEVHEAIIGDMAIQDAWEVAEAAATGGPPGSIPDVSIAPDVAGLRVVVRSGERADVTWTVPADPDAVRALIIGCHIPGHWERGMQADVRVPPGSGLVTRTRLVYAVDPSRDGPVLRRPGIFVERPRGGDR